MQEARWYIVREKTYESPLIASLSLTLEDGTIPAFRPGQHIVVYFPDLDVSLGKPYSISSARIEERFTITVKAIGAFSKRLCSLAVGDRFLATLPQGAFHPRRGGGLVLVAGAMGVMPFRGIIIDLLESTERSIALLYSAKSRADMPYRDTFVAHANRKPQFTLQRFITREQGAEPEVRYRRMLPADLPAYDTNDTEYLLSGSLSFVLAQRDALLSHGIDRTSILTEARF